MQLHSTGAPSEAVPQELAYAEVALPSPPQKLTDPDLITWKGHDTCSTLVPDRLLEIPSRFGLPPVHELAQLGVTHATVANATLLPAVEGRKCMMVFGSPGESTTADAKLRMAKLCCGLADQRVGQIVFAIKPKVLHVDTFASDRSVTLPADRGPLTVDVQKVAPSMSGAPEALALSVTLPTGETERTDEIGLWPVRLEGATAETLHTTIKNLHEAAGREMVAFGCRGGNTESGILAILYAQRLTAEAVFKDGEAPKASELVSASTRWTQLCKRVRSDQFAAKCSPTLLQEHAELLEQEFRQRGEFKPGLVPPPTHPKPAQTAARTHTAATAGVASNASTPSTTEAIAAHRGQALRLQGALKPPKKPMGAVHPPGHLHNAVTGGKPQSAGTHNAATVQRELDDTGSVSDGSDSLYSTVNDALSVMSDDSTTAPQWVPVQVEGQTLHSYARLNQTPLKDHSRNLYGAASELPAAGAGAAAALRNASPAVIPTEGLYSVAAAEEPRFKASTAQLRRSIHHTGISLRRADTAPADSPKSDRSSLPGAAWLSRTHPSSGELTSYLQHVATQFVQEARRGPLGLFANKETYGVGKAIESVKSLAVTGGNRLALAEAIDQSLSQAKTDEDLEASIALLERAMFSELNKCFEELGDPAQKNTWLRRSQQRKELSGAIQSMAEDLRRIEAGPFLTTQAAEQAARHAQGMNMTLMALNALYKVGNDPSRIR
ncbi:hypothetical protein OU995_05170 [Roseateles sp. SL47]|uniref:hypothetical protein n=1 Tax=Roseateles sp. SL47 TaxID=2995138 RepID=UPI00226FECD8|nr:hypothetical protein [Roseateles sp. SL47]WAC74122.1 hypothetical protein OU995_05170 [Roseateles sp. SL47]